VIKFVARKRYLTSTHVGRLCEADPKVVRGWADEGLIKSFRTPGGHLRFHQGDVLVFMRKFGFLKETDPVPLRLQRPPENAE
jgi:DNA-binding transcriptional MerR regulator